jgi:hypothetical protein
MASRKGVLLGICAIHSSPTLYLNFSPYFLRSQSSNRPPSLIG